MSVLPSETSTLEAEVRRLKEENRLLQDMLRIERGEKPDRVPDHWFYAAGQWQRKLEDFPLNGVVWLDQSSNLWAWYNPREGPSEGTCESALEAMQTFDKTWEEHLGKQTT